MPPHKTHTYAHSQPPQRQNPHPNLISAKQQNNVAATARPDPLLRACLFVKRILHTFCARTIKHLYILYYTWHTCTACAHRRARSVRMPFVCAADVLVLLVTTGATRRNIVDGMRSPKTMREREFAGVLDTLTQTYCTSTSTKQYGSHREFVRGSQNGENYMLNSAFAHAFSSCIQEE